MDNWLLLQHHSSDIPINITPYLPASINLLSPNGSTEFRNSHLLEFEVYYFPNNISFTHDNTS